MLLVRLFRPIRYSLLILSLALIALTMKADHSVTSASAAAKPNEAMPGLQGQPAVDYLKQHGMFESVKAAVEADRHEIKWRPEAGGTYQANNSGQNLQASFSRDGALIAPRESCDGASWQMAMKLRGVGYGQRLSKVAPGPMRATDNRIEYAHSLNLPNLQSATHNPQLTEWYINKPEGIEQGFTLTRRPGESFGILPLRLALSVTGGLRASLEDDGQAAALAFPNGRQALRYDHLAAYDALGRSLPARMEVSEGEISLLVDDTNAVYPVTIDPLFTQVKKITASDGVAGDNFGFSVAISGDTAIVGAVGDDTAKGSAYVFERNKGGADLWGEVKKLTALDSAESAQFGVSVAISGDTAIVGAFGDDGNKGSAYLFERNRGGADLWGEVKKLTASDGASGDNFGYSVALSSDTAIVGAYLDDSQKGSAYVFGRNQGGADNWGEVKKLTASDGEAPDRFGVSVSLSGDAVIIGAWRDDNFKGSAYVFERNQGGADNWGEVKKLSASDGLAGDRFGWSVALSDDTAIVGGYFDDNQKGSSYIFASDCNWVEKRKPVASDGAADNQFGYSVAISGDTAIVGVFNADSRKGSAYVFARNKGGAGLWAEVKKLTASDGAAGDRFGFSVALSGNTAIVGALNDDSSKGSAYVFERNKNGADLWGEVKKLTASDGVADDAFGLSMAISGDTAIVGAIGDDDKGSASGAAYVFERNQGGADLWGEVKKLTASDGEANDAFGISVAISGDTAIVGAYHDDVNKGAAYIFERNQGGADLWGQVKKLTASDGASNDYFGYSVALSGNSAIVGSYGDDQKGAAYVFERNQGGADLWGEVKKLTASDGRFNDYFGLSVAISGDTAIVGAYSNNATQGAAYIFAQNRGGADLWGEVKKLTASDGAAGDYFGISVAISGDTAIVGAYGDEGFKGSSYIFVCDPNTPPTINAVAMTRTEGTGSSNFTIANVSDAEDAENTLAVTINGVIATGLTTVTVNGVTISNLTVDTAGVVKADAVAACGASDASFTLKVTDSGSLMMTAALNMTVMANTPPVLSYGAASVNAGNSTTNNPTTATDNGSISSYSIVSVVPALTAAPTVNASGLISITNAGPSGNHTITVQATDNCGATSTATFNLIVNGPPIINATAITRQQGSPSDSAVQIATVSDDLTQAGLLQVYVIPGGSATGITLGPNPSGTISTDGIKLFQFGNTDGVITATVSASCTATSGTVRLQVTDGGGLTATGDLQVNVTANTVPTLTYDNQAVALDGSLNVSPTTATDNGLITSYSIVSVVPPLSIGPMVNSSGVVSLTSAGPGGNHVITVQATDNCNATTNAMFTLTINCPMITLGTYPNTGVMTGGNITVTPSAAPSGSIMSITAAATGVNQLPFTGAFVVNPTTGVVTITDAKPAGTYTVTVTVTDNCWATTNASFMLTVNCQAITINPASLPNGFQGTAYNQTLIATGGSAPYSFAVTTGSLPDGLNLTSDGELTGTPTTAGTFNFTVTATDNNGCTGTHTYTLGLSGTGLQFYPLAHPLRLLDTRPVASGCDAPGMMISGGTARTQTAAGRTCDGLTIPANAKALTGNITTVESGGGFLTLYPSDITRPLVANSNFTANQVLNNVFTVGLGAIDGAFNIFVTTNTNVVVDITGYYAPPTISGLYFHPLPKPVRLMDSRVGATACFTPNALLTADSTTTQLGTTTCDGVLIPAGALALVGNATVVNPQANGFLTLFPADATRPLAASSNFQTGINMNAPFTVGLSPSGQFSIYTAATTDLVVDVLGYYSTQLNDTNGQGLLFNSLPTPVRLLDTRAGATGCFTPGAQMTGGTPYLQPAIGACTGIPASAKAVVGNATTVNVSANGFLTFWPSDASQPNVATSNYRSGTVFNRHFTVGLGLDGAFKRFASSTTDLVIDLSGYFAP